MRILIEIDAFFYDVSQYQVMSSEKKQEKKNEDDEQKELLDGKALHDLYRHTTKLIK
ncbi:MAG: hypothetical protein KGH76_01940 [Thaumarchaeota archaeon]|nr:hypothetical protein [Nitrososphaerota archaeon]